jgi:hypothetical protein
MKIFSALDPISKELLTIAAQKRKKFEQALDPAYIHPQEDFLLKSEKYPIFVVADGVTLELDKEGKYPSPSGAGELARIFCTAVIREAERMYDTFEEGDIKTLFELANRDAGAYNASQGRTKSTINYWDIDLFAATTAFMLIKNNKVYWWALCDSGFKLLDKGGKHIFTSPEAWTEELKAKLAQFAHLDSFAKRTSIRRTFRNGVNDTGELMGYGVVTGEDIASKYLHSGVVDFTEGSIAMIYTDGFEEYVTMPEFINLFVDWKENLQEELQGLSQQYITSDPSTYGHERSIIVVSNK